ncbi:hypothetical protein AFLA_004076 [Aspergillus flavus NRRL3357]|nr:hypothetical protein AFLA_004076 [Aspergillus flavus NRRL3357]
MPQQFFHPGISPLRISSTLTTVQLWLCYSHLSNGHLLFYCQRGYLGEKTLRVTIRFGVTEIDNCGLNLLAMVTPHHHLVPTERASGTVE